MMYFGMALLALVLIGFGVMRQLIGANNRLMALQARCDSAFADVDVHLKHRHNLIPGLVETVRGFAGHERELLGQVNANRAEAVAAMTPDMKLASEKKLTQNITALINLSNSYPDLKASSHFVDLRQELIDCENRITAARRFFNLTVEEYNATLGQFPASYIGRKRRLSARPVYDLGIERVLLDEPVAIKF